MELFNENKLTYTQMVNAKIREQFEAHKHSVIFGQNIIAGSRISGLGANLENISGVHAINTTNSENSLMGMGFGLSLAGIPSIFIMKQHDFAVLGLDQLTNTHNLIKNGGMSAAFIVLMVVIDSGNEGPQASLSSLDEFASLTRAPVHYLSTTESIDLAFQETQKPGLHFLALGQKSMKKKVLEAKHSPVLLADAIIYPVGNQNETRVTYVVVIVGTGVDFALDVVSDLNASGVLADLIVISRIHSNFSPELLSLLERYETVVIIDTGKSEVHYSTNLAAHLLQQGIKTYQFPRKPSLKWSQVIEDKHEILSQDIVNTILQSGAK
jgi:pyruvate/2-oxoglutarate/acetoin dehydrogenase E1 component